MGIKLEWNNLIFYQKIDEILWSSWDPIWVHWCDSARDEYYWCIPRTYKLSIQEDWNELLSFLLQIEVKSMWLSWNKQNCKKVVEEIKDLKKKLKI